VIWVERQVEKFGNSEIIFCKWGYRRRAHRAVARLACKRLFGKRGPISQYRALEVGRRKESPPVTVRMSWMYDSSAKSGVPDSFATQTWFVSRLTFQIVKLPCGSLICTFPSGSVNSLGKTSERSTAVYLPQPRCAAKPSNFPFSSTASPPTDDLNTEIDISCTCNALIRIDSLATNAKFCFDDDAIHSLAPKYSINDSRIWRNVLLNPEHILHSPRRLHNCTLQEYASSAIHIELLRCPAGRGLASSYTSKFLLIIVDKTERDRSCALSSSR
jgi:hypothetical protein